MAKAAKPIGSQLGRLLGTEDPEAQVKVAESLMRVVTSPVISLMIVADTRTGNVSLRAIAPDDLPFGTYYRILDSARQLILEKERASLQPAQPESQPPQE